MITTNGVVFEKLNSDHWGMSQFPIFTLRPVVKQQPHDHALKLVTVFAGGKWFCDVCRAEGRPLDSVGGAAGAGQPLRRFRCYDCADYDLCGDCVQANLSSV